MPVVVKIIFSLISVILYIVVCFAKRGHKDSEKWLIGKGRGGVSSNGFDISFWPFVCNEDGTFKRHGRLFILGVFIAINVIMWVEM